MINKNENAKFETVLFDLDGTLTDPKEGICKSAQHALRHFGIDEPDLKKLEVVIGPNLYNSFENIFGLSTEDACEAVRVFRERYGEIGWCENEIYPGMADMLKRLKASGKTLIVASLKPAIFVDRILEHFDIKKYFTVTMGTVIEANRDTKGQVMEEALRQAGIDLNNPEVDRTKIAMVGDRKDDIEGASDCSVTSIGVKYGYSIEDELERAGANYVINTIAELEALLNK